MHPLIEKNRENIATLCRRYGVRHLAVFGSILREDFDPAHSDVDLVGFAVLERAVQTCVIAPAPATPPASSETPAGPSS